MRKQIPLLAAALALGLTAACGASRGEDTAGALKGALEQAGWTARSLPDGGLEVVVPAAPVSTPDEAAATPPAAGSAAPTPATWQRLGESGWRVEHKPDGSTLLHPPPMAAPPLEAAPEAPAVESPVGGAVWEQLRASGWRVERDADGSTLLYPPAFLAPAPSVPARPAGEAEVFEHLRAQGWRVERDADGSVLLFPRAEQVSTSEGPAQAPPGEVGLMGLADPLEARGWRVARGDDGSLLLYPRVDDPAAPTKRPVEACPGEQVTLVRDGGISLPVDGQDAARVIAASWLAAVESPEALLVGRIRQVNRVFLVSIVMNAPPHRLLHQIAINSRTGRVIVLF
jgi:hypothetical protein